jgi:hypothetical protein
MTDELEGNSCGLSVVLSQNLHGGTEKEHNILAEIATKHLLNMTLIVTVTPFHLVDYS